MSSEREKQEIKRQGNKRYIKFECTEELEKALISTAISKNTTEFHIVRDALRMYLTKDLGHIYEPQKRDCKCWIDHHGQAGSPGYIISYCPLHAAAEGLFSALEDLATRAERARKILQESPRGGNWGMLDTKSVRIILASAKREKETS